MQGEEFGECSSNLVNDEGRCKRPRLDEDVQQSNSNNPNLDCIECITNRAEQFLNQCAISSCSTGNEERLHQWQMNQIAIANIDNSFNTIFERFPDRVVDVCPEPLRPPDMIPNCVIPDPGIVNEGVTLAIKSYGLQAPANIEAPEDYSDNAKIDDVGDDILEAAVSTAINLKGLCSTSRM